jgi:hypothetical protein
LSENSVNDARKTLQNKYKNCQKNVKTVQQSYFLQYICHLAFSILVSVTLGVEKKPTGGEILKGVNKEIRVLGLEPSQILKENFETAQTGAGMTDIRLANENELRLGKTRPDYLIVAIGKPKVGN